MPTVPTCSLTVSGAQASRHTLVEFSAMEFQKVTLKIEAGAVVLSEAQMGKSLASRLMWL